MVWMTMLVLAGPSLADDGEKADVSELLSAIPEIVAPVDPKKEEKKPKVVEGMDLDGYFNECRAAVYKYFKAPKSVVKQMPDVELTFLVKVDEQGYIVDLSVPQRSGFKSFDQAALKALKKADPLPAPPSGWSVSMDRVLIPFTAESGR